MDALDGPAEAIFVDDGSSDAGPIVLEAKARSDPRYRFIKLSRNFGHQIAITTGMERAAGKAVVVMDADLQDPPEIVLEMIAKWKEGYEIVYAQRLSRAGESAFKRVSADLFYRLIGKLSDVEIPRDVGDFRLVDRKALDCFLAMPERERFVRGMFAWIGFRQAVVSFHRPAARGRRNQISAGQDGPARGQRGRVVLRRAVALRALGRVSPCPRWRSSTASRSSRSWFAHADFERGWSSTIVLVAFLGGANMLMTGILGVYVGRIYAEVKRRPLYVIDRSVGFDRDAGARLFGNFGALPRRRA